MSPISPSLSTDSGVGTIRQRLLEDKEIVSNGEFVFSTEDDGPMDLSISGQLSTTNDFGGLRGIVSDDGEDLTVEGPMDLTQNDEKIKRLVPSLLPFAVPSGDELEGQGPAPDVTKSQGDDKKSKRLLRKRKVPTSEPQEKNRSDEDKESIR